jgi:electron transport complex protein RnfC
MNKVIAEKNAPVVVEPLHCRYPQGGEKQLCQAITGKQVPPGGLPSNIGCAVFNINTTCAIYRAITTGMPVVRKVVTVSGSGVVEPKNLECPIGTPVWCLFDACGGLDEKTYKLVMGGPMMGMAQYTTDVPVGKGTGAMLAFCAKEEQTVAHPQCIRCGKCVSACPMHLEPLFMYQYAEKGMVDELNEAHIMDCKAAYIDGCSNSQGQQRLVKGNDQRHSIQRPLHRQGFMGTSADDQGKRSNHWQGREKTQVQFCPHSVRRETRWLHQR